MSWSIEQEDGTHFGRGTLSDLLNNIKYIQCLLTAVPAVRGGTPGAAAVVAGGQAAYNYTYTQTPKLTALEYWLN